MDTTRINHNNSGHKYRIAVDIAKEGSHIWDLTPYFKGRVGDNNFGLQVTWYYQGQLMNVVGMKPYIEGLVGQYSFGKNGEIDMDPDAVPVRYDGSPDDCEEAGKATLYFPSQMFPKEGIFKGFIGVKDDRDGSKNPQISGVTIWFKVLPGIAQMGHACDAYVDELDKALQNFKVKLDQHDKDYQTQLQQVIDDARNTYETETKNSHDAALAANAELSKLREDITKASHSIGDVQNQIDADNIVTTNDFKKVTDETKNLINDRLKHISSNPETFASLDALKAKYPSGADGLFRVGNEGYIWENNAWTSTGEIASTMISDADFNQRLGSFMFFDNDQHVEITERYSDDLSAHVGTMTVSNGILIYLADQGYFKSTDTLNLKYTYTQTQVDQNGCMTLYFDNSSQLYFAFKPVRRNDVKLFSIYKGKIYGGINTDRIYVNGVNYGGWGSDSIYGYAMLLPMFPDDDNHIEVEYKNDKDNWKYKVTYSSMNIIGSNGSHVTAGSGTVEGQGNAITPLNLYYSSEDKNCYLDTHGHNSNDYFIGTLYGQYVYGQNVDAFIVNGIDKGGFGHKNRSLQVMAAAGDDPIKVSLKNWEYSVAVPPTLNFIDADCNHWGYRGRSQNLSFEGQAGMTINLFYSDENKEFYLDEFSHSSHDYHISTLYGDHSYGSNNEAIIVNNIANGGWGSDSIYGYAMLLPMFPDDDNHIEVEYKNDKDNWKYKVTYSSMNIIGSNGSHVTAGSGTVEGQGNAITPLNLYYSSEDKNCYLDTHGHNSNDYFIGTLYGQYAYGQNVDAFVVNGFSKGGFGKSYRPYTLTDWRIDAENSQESNIVWFGDSTFAGYKVQDPKNIAANYINNFLVTNFPKVRSYNCSISGWTTWALADAFEKQIANIPTPKLVLMGGGINDVSGGMASGERIVQSREGLRNFVRKVQSIGAVPIICTTQASMLLYARYAEGGDWDLEQNWYARINEMRRDFAKENNLPLLDMEKFDTAFIEYGPSKLNEMFDDQMHGHDPINRFEAQLVMAYLSKDQLDFINHDQIIDLSTMKAKSTSEYNKTNQELDDPVLNAKGFKSHMVRSNVDSDLTIIDYQFFIPASEEQYYLNGYNLGDPVNVSLNGDITQLTGTQKVATLEPGYYHVIVKPTTANINFVGLRIETNNLTESTVQPAETTDKK